VVWVCAILLLLLAGCSSSWRAPIETRAAAVPANRHADLPGPHDATYRVRRGDTLYAIAWHSNNDYRQLARWNGIRSPYTIYPGQVLRLRPPPAPPRKNTPPPPREAKQTTRPAVPARASSPPPQSQPAPRPAPRQEPVSAGKALRWAWPANGQLKSRYKADDPLRKGIKLGGQPGEPVRAAESGKVMYSGSGLIGYGRLIIIKHNENYLSAYGHNRKLLVEQGQQVTKGQKIAELGTSNDGKPLLHFEIRRRGKPVDPLALLPRR
jgi:lipoprotein NlpD